METGVPVPEAAPGPAFTAAAALSVFLAPPAAYLASLGPDAASDTLVVGAAVVVRRPAAAAPRLLLVRRGRRDFGGGCWETPGGRYEAARDASLLAAAARELREEAGLAARRFAGRVAVPHTWIDPPGGGRRWRKLTFLVEVGRGGPAAEEKEEEEEEEGEEGSGLPAVRLDPDEHEDYVWASEREVRAGRAGERVFTWIGEDQRTVVLDAFALARRLEAGGKEEAVGAEADGKGHVNTDASSQ